MALRENQFYQIGLIISVMLMVVLAVLAFWGFSQANQEAENNQNLRQQLDAAENVRRSAEAAADAIKIMVGTEPGELDTMLGLVTDTEIKNELDRVIEAYNTDMGLYTTTSDDPNSRSWRGLVNNLMTSLTTKIQDLNTAQDSQRQAEAEKNARVAEADSRADQAEAEARDLTDKLNAALAENRAILEQFNTKLAEAEASHAEGVAEFNNQIAQQRSELTTLQQEVASKTTALKAKIGQLKQYQRTKFPVADGRIVDVAAGQDRVYINLGFDDGLRRRVSFSVFGRGIQLEAGLEKAAVEVTRILGPHQAEARITRSSERDPILPNDSIVTASWDPGYEVPVAIAGTVDIDGDGVSDLDRFRALVQKNQGVIAAYADEEGNVQGEIHPDVRYLILGAEPEGDQQRQAYSALTTQADRYYVQLISVREFLHLNGYAPVAPIQNVNVLPADSGFVPRRPPAGASAFDR